jgi:hypothetical protein
LLSSRGKRAEHFSDDPTFVRVSIADCGRGIDPEHTAFKIYLPLVEARAESPLHV